MYVCDMKNIISLQIIHELNKQGLRLTSPFLQKVSDGFIVTWEHQSISWACQGNYERYERWYSFKDYDFDKAMQRLTDYIRSKYRECL